jgi:Na+/H+-dicarboxylate symporter
MFMPSNLDPDQMEEIQRQQEQFNSPMFKVIGSVIGMAVSAIFGAIGGAIGASVFKKGSPDQGMDIEA